ncbi:MAG: nucleotidyltransferase domain-containing protein [Nanoarchaeota archaeon]
MIKSDIRWNILKEFFEYPDKGFYVRELARRIKVNHTSVSQHLKILVKEGLLKIEKEEIYPKYKVAASQKFFYIKQFYNLEKIRESFIIEVLQHQYDFPTIVIFGSYAQGIDNKNSDIDLFVLTNIKEKFKGKIEEYEKKLNREISLHFFTKKEFEEAKKKNKELINNIANGIVVGGQLEIL